MASFYWTLGIIWIVFWTYWAVSAFGVKKVINRPRPSWYYLIIIVIVVFIYLSRQPSFHIVLFTQYMHAVIAGIIVAVIGLAFAVWARVHLGRNWSSGPSIQENHELVTSGPYRYVRHPIYTGILVGLLGNLIAIGSVVYLIVFILFIVVFVARIRLEEKFMMQLFPNTYPDYKKGTKALIPFIW